MRAARPAPSGPVEMVVKDVLLEAGSWQIVEQHAEYPPRVSMVLPSFAKRELGAERPALILPPPASVTIQIEEDAGELRFDPRAGVGYRFRPPRNAAGQAARVEFEIEVDGQLVRQLAIECADDVDDTERDWLALGEPLTLAPGARVTLRTKLVPPPGVALEELSPEGRLPAGFAELAFHRRFERVRRSATPETPNIVLVVMDTLRADALGAYGARGKPTPHLDALASRGVLYEEAYATSSWTWPSTASILTGMEPDEHGLVDDEASFLNTGLETLPELLFERDYLTAAFSCNPLVIHQKRFDQGFEVFDDYGDFRYSPAVVPSVLDWLDNNAGSRFFLYLHLVDTHIPYQLEPEFARKLKRLPTEPMSKVERRVLAGEGHRADGSIDLDQVVSSRERDAMIAQYRAAVRSADLWVGRLLERLHQLGLDETTVVAFTSDHGEELWDHGLGTHGFQVYEELVRVPLIVAGPGTPRGERVAVPVSNRHLAPTLARLGGAQFEGLSDARDLLDPTQREARPIAFSTHNGRWHRQRDVSSIFGLRDGDWVVHYAPLEAPYADPDGPRGQLRLFDLSADPQQTSDRAGLDAARAANLRDALIEHLQTTGARRKGVAVGAGSQTLKLLRDIGYVDGDD